MSARGQAGPTLGNGLAVRVGACEGVHKVAAAPVSRYETSRPRTTSGSTGVIAPPIFRNAGRAPWRGGSGVSRPGPCAAGPRRPARSRAGRRRRASPGSGPTTCACSPGSSVMSTSVHPTPTSAATRSITTLASSHRWHPGLPSRVMRVGAPSSLTAPPSLGHSARRARDVRARPCRSASAAGRRRPRSPSDA